jgi:small-conductance mechanosensitive channel
VIIATMSWFSVRPFVIPLVIVLIATGVGAVLQFVVLRRVNESSLLRRNMWLSIAFDSLGASVMIWTAALGVYVAITTSAATQAVIHLLDSALAVLVLSSVTVAVARFTGSAVLRLSGSPGQQLASGTLFASVSQSLVGIMGGLIILQTLGIQIAPLLAALGVGGLAVALALQPPLANLFSGLQLVASRQIRPGDYVELQGGQQGFVEDINWRSISIREPTNNLLVVPNQVLAQAVFTNYRLPEPQVSARVPIRVAYGSDLAFVEQLALEAANLTREDIGRDRTSHDAYVRFEEFGDATVNLAVHFLVPKIVDQERARSVFLRRFYELLQRNGIGSPVQNPVIPLPEGVLGR